MSDCEESDFLWESVTFPGKIKRESKSRCKNDTAMKTDGMQKKKKKNSKSKGAMINKKEKKKDKKKKKKKLVSDRLDSIVFTKASVPLAKPGVNPETTRAPSNEKPQPDLLTQGGKPKRKKKVAFDLLPLSNISVKRPKFVSSSLLCPKKSILFKNEEVGDSEICSQVTVTGHSQWTKTQETQENDSQCNSEDINSQDLFITQKTFRVPSPEFSSGEASDKAFSAIPQFTQQSMLHSSQARTHRCSGDSRVYKRKPKQVSPVEEKLDRIHRKEKNGKLLLETQMTTGPNLSEERKSLSPVYKISSLSPSMAVPSVIPPSPGAAKSKKQFYILNQRSRTSTSTQTENFFTTELSSYLDFCQKQRANSNTEELKPLDLSLPQRARRNLWPSMKMPFLPGQVQEDDHKAAHLQPSSSPSVKEVQEEIPGHKSETTPSPQFESEPKSADMTTSSEDNEPPSRPGKLDLAQVRRTVT